MNKDTNKELIWGEIEVQDLLKKLYKDTERDFFMSAQEACEYHLIDKVLPSKKIKSK